MTNAFSKLRPVYKINLDVRGSYHDCWCQWNALQNLEKFGKPLKRVFGSVAFNGWFEYGGPTYTLKKFQENPRDSHCWLEDKDGNVYDYCQPSWLAYAIQNKHFGKLPLGVEFRGTSKKELQAQGLTYVPAPADAQNFMHGWVSRHVPSWKSMHLGEWRPEPINEEHCGF